MKIGFLVNDISNVGGVERVVATLSDYFEKEYNYSVEIISVYKSKRNRLSFDFNDNVKITYLNYDESWNGFIHDFKYQYKIFSKILTNIDVDVLFTMYTSVNVIVGLLKNKLNYKVIPCQHGQYYYDSKGWNILKRIIYRKLDILVSLTERDKEIYEKFIKDVRVIPNSVPFKREYLYDKYSKKIVSIGRLSEEKSISYLIDGFNLICNKNPQWKLEIVGEGAEKEMLQEKVKEYGIQSQVIFTPFTLDVKSKYKEAGFTVLTSQSEALPMMLIESKCLGIPSISFDIRTGPREIIKDKEDGYLIEKNNINQLAKYMNSLMNNNRLREEMSKKAFDNSYKFDVHYVCEMWNELINEIISR